MKLYRQIMAKYAPNADVNDVYHVYAMAVAYAFIDALGRAGNPPTRTGIMRAVTHLNEQNNPFALPGVVVRTTSTDHFPIAQARLQRYHNGHWVYFGPLVRVG